MRRALTLAVVSLLLITACGRKKRAGAVPMVRVGATETGIASWYGHPYHGRASASGEIYDMEQMTAAHRTLPFGTWVRVHNLQNDKRVEVRVNDRGPFWDGRIVDLSRAAARAIDMIGPGTARVRLEVIRGPAPALGARFAVQVGAFRNRSNADRVRQEMEQKFGTSRLIRWEGDVPVWRVLVGTEVDEDAAAVLAGKIRGLGNRTAFVVRLDNLPQIDANGRE